MSARVTTKQVRALALMVVSGAAIWAVSSFYLADTGSTTLNIQPASNLPSGGSFDVTPMSSTLTRPNGNATIQAGVAIERVKLIKGSGSKLKVDMAWLDPRDSAQVLNNPNAQVYVGIYHPVEQGNACGAATPSVGATEATITDDLDGNASNETYCAQVDPNAGGSMMIKESGSSKLLLSPSNVTGYISSSLDDSATVDCTTTNTSTWCHPSVLASNGGYNYNVVWVVLTIVTPGGKPAGQQNNINSLSFFAQAKSL